MENKFKIILIYTVFTLQLIMLVSCKDKKVYVQDDKSKNEQFKDTVKKNEDKNIKKKYAISKYFTPVLYTKDFSDVYGGKDGKTLKRSKTGLIKELEYVAYPGSSFEILESYPKGDYFIYKVYTDEYDISELHIELFIDSRFVELSDKKPDKRKMELPTKEKIYQYFKKSLGSLYVWGGNNVDGVDEMMRFYPPKGELSEKEKKEWGLKGVDCSGLLYEATNGFTARNTHQLVYYGQGVSIRGLSASQIAKRVKPLDLIVWKGHVIIIYDSVTTIESAHSAGCVLKKNLISALEKIMLKRSPADEWKDGENIFVIRRWYPNK